MTQKPSCQTLLRSRQKKSGPYGIRSCPTSSGRGRSRAGVRMSLQGRWCRLVRWWHNSLTNKNEGMYMNLNPLATVALVMIGLAA